MTNILLRLFIKNCEDTQNPAVRSSIGKLAGLTGIVCNCLLTVLKLVIGLLVGSMAIIADGVNNLSDAASSLTTLLGFRMAQRPADKQHPYGHARYEYLSGLAVAALILLIGAELVKSSIAKIIKPEPIDISAATIALLAASVAVKLWMSGFYKTLGKKINSTALYATSVDSRNDVISTCAVLLGCLVNYLFGLNIDGYVGLAVAIFILYSSVGIAKDTISPLLGQQADDELVDKITELVLSHEKVLGVHDLLVHDYGPGRCYASAHVELSADEDPMACHDIIDDIECDVLEKMNVHFVIHYDPVVQNDAEQNEMRRTVGEIIRELNPAFSIHDFRIVRGSAQSKLVFDLGVPYSMIEKKKEIKERIDAALNERGKKYITIIRFDGIA
ncbi:cation diffusion facilitator family transporter [uncultured Cloacibacillus sp.]|uniref:cation diffusion facilitator family transporter n=1 Tax=uncultured Cloacibacillus sp. TaxID=889794 RepID=UPI0026DBED3A|nr:cation diffusion facilitator family transporter [uncultured Cloacibacillus sp.]